MSGFEMHRFRAIDRPLNQEEMNEIDSWSSRFSPNSTGVTYIYHYGSFKRDVNQVFPKFFDAMLYVDSWGTRQLMFRLPKKLVKWADLIEYTNIFEETSLDFRKKADYIIMDMQWHEEEGGGWMEEEDYLLDPLLSLRQDILRGDYRLLLLGWLKVHQERRALHSSGDMEDFLNEFLDEFEEDELVTPPIPPNMKTLNTAHLAFIEMFEIDDKLIAALSKESVTSSRPKKDYKKLIKSLSEEEKEDYLLRLAKENSRLGIELRQKLSELETGGTVVPDNRLSWEALEKKLRR